VLDGTSLASHARAIDDQTFEIDRTFVERMLSGESSASAPRLRAIPHVRDGRTIGVKLFGVRRDSAFGLLGFQNGDLLLSIDGYDIAVPDQALEAYARLRDATTHGILLERRGAPRLHVLRVVDDR
jgi:general secretion pathway protein C